MASRRSRIKGIAHIPQRRKTAANPEQDDVVTKTIEKPNKPSLNVSDENITNPKEESENCSDHLNNSRKNVESKFVVDTDVQNNELHIFTKITDKYETETNENNVSVGPLAAPGTIETEHRNDDKEYSNFTKLYEKKAQIQMKVCENDEKALKRLEERQKHIEKDIKRISVTETSKDDSAYPPAPMSPSKINRGRIKVAPRLGKRRTSISASESEDDNRKSNRHRNDSVCSTTSGIADQSYALESPHSPKKEFANVMQRKFKRTEQSRKLAEARREYMQKFGTSKPDRQKLTMMDLIFYNPTTNPMSQKRKGGTNSNEDVSEEEKEGEADQPEEVVVTDEENEGLPAPQIKVGPDGEITIDEKSLVIENKQVKRSKEKIQKSKLVDGDSATTYGVYKKVERTKLWSKRETLRFYKALNAIGTDFSLMLPLFPGRKRRDLTMKFKKEEKVNRTLIDRALMEPNTYDISELRREIELEEREEREKERVKREVEQLARKEAEEKRKKRGEKNTEKKSAPASRKRSQSARKLYKDLNKGVNSFLDESDADDESDVSSQSALEVTLEMVQSSTKTKSLRPRKVKRIYTDPEESDDNDNEKEIEQQIVVTKRIEEKPSEKEGENNAKLEPGSVLIYSSEGPDGNPVYKFFMVAPIQGEQMNVNDNTKNILNIGTLRIEENNAMTPEENNVTIPAEHKLEENSNNPNCIIQQNILIKPGTDTLEKTINSEHE